MTNYALITGANRGIGLAIAHELAARKFNIILAARDKDVLESAASELRTSHGISAVTYGLDLASRDSIYVLHEWVKTNGYNVSILVNNAGFGVSGAFVKESAERHVAMIDVNVTAPVLLTHLFLPLLQQQPKAYILNVASTAAYQAVPFLGTYAATKAFMLSFSRSLSYELRKTTVSVTCLSPGPTDTLWASRANVQGPKAVKLAEKFNMQPNVVARAAVEGLFAERREVIPGLINKLGAFAAWLIPKRLVESSSAGLYE